MRQVLKFLIPVTVESLGRDDLTGRAIVPVYINPDSINISKNKNISSTQTKGGYVVQYWGEQLTEMTVRGSTGSGGIEAINILDSVYRNEITQFNKILLARATNADTSFRTALEDSSTANIGSGLVSIFDEFTNGGVSGIIDGTKSAIDEIVDAARGTTDDNPSSVPLIPTIGAFGVSMIIFWQGVKYTGYFKNFSYSEDSSKPGLFDYDFSFTVIKQKGTRKNFMPWHRNPYDYNNEPRSASIPIEGARLDELTFPTTETTFRGQINPNSNNLNSRTSNFSPATEPKIANAVPINRNATIKGK